MPENTLLGTRILYRNITTTRKITPSNTHTNISNPPENTVLNGQNQPENILKTNISDDNQIISEINENRIYFGFSHSMHRWFIIGFFLYGMMIISILIYKLFGLIKKI